SDAPADLAGAAAVRLDDGTVLVVGGHDRTGAARAQAWIYRPALAGPFSVARATPGLDEAAPLDPLDPAEGEVQGTAWTLHAAGEALASWAILGGPELLRGTVTATLKPTGGLAVLLGFVDPSRFDAVILPVGGAARVERHAPGAIT